MAIIDTLKNGIKEEIEGGISEFNLNRYKNALILFSKALFSMSDYLIAIRNLKLPENHEERFRILERYMPKIYYILDRLFKKYTDTYLKPTEKESCMAMKNAIKKLAESENFDKEIKEIAEKI